MGCPACARASDGLKSAIATTAETTSAMSMAFDRCIMESSGPRRGVASNLVAGDGPLLIFIKSGARRADSIG